MKSIGFGLHYRRPTYLQQFSLGTTEETVQQMMAKVSSMMGVSHL